MAQFTVNTYRFDPYKNFKFRVKWDNKTVAGVSKVSALKRSTEVVSHREGGDFSTPHLSPSSWKWEPITLERGVTYDLEFEKWANFGYSNAGDGAISMANFRKEITIELLTEQHIVAKAYNIHKAWVSEYQAMAELDANAHAILLEHVVIQCEGWERDEQYTEQPQK